MCTPYQLIRFIFQADKTKLDKIKITQHAYYCNLNLDPPPLFKLNFDQVADIGFFGNFQTLIHGYDTICMNNVKTI